MLDVGCRWGQVIKKHSTLVVGAVFFRIRRMNSRIGS